MERRYVNQPARLNPELSSQLPSRVDSARPGNDLRPSVPVREVRLAPFEPQAVLVVHIQDESTSFIRLKSENSRYLKLLSEMMEFYLEELEDDYPLGSVFSPGTPVAVHAADGCYHRAVVLETLSANNLSVRLIDIGRVENVALFNVQPLHWNFLTEPPFALECDILGWTASNFGYDFKEPVELMAQVIETNDGAKLIIRLYKDVNVHDSKEAANRRISQISPQDVEGSQMMTLSNRTKYSAPEVSLQSFDARFHYLPDNILMGNNNLLVTISDIAANNFCVTVVEGNYGQLLNTLNQQMNWYYENLGNGSNLRSLLRVDGVCAAKFETDGNWYRAVIVNPPDSTCPLVEVRYVDYGNCSIIAPELIRQLNPEFLELPVMGYACQVNGCLPRPPLPIWTDETLQFMRRFLNMEAKCFIERRLEDGTHVADISIRTREGGWISVAELLKKADLPVLNVSVVSTRPTSGVGAKFFPERPLIPPKGPVEPVEVVSVTDPSLFYIHLLKEKAAFDAVTKSLTQNYVDQPVENVERPVIRGSACVVYCLVRKTWFRGQIVHDIGVENGGILVKLVDRGEEVVCSHEYVCDVKENVLLKIPPLAVPCRLSGIKPESDFLEWPKSVVVKFKNMMPSKCKCKFDGEVCENGVYPVSLMMFTGRSLADMLVQKDLAVLDDPELEGSGAIRSERMSKEMRRFQLKNGTWNWNIPGFLPLDLEIGTGDFLDVTAASIFFDDGCLYFQPEHEKKRLELFCQNLNSYYSNANEDSRMMNPTAGDVGVAKSADNSMYYRVVVMGRKEKNTLTVRTVDYGFGFTASINDVHKLHSEFVSHYPPFAFPSELYSVSAEQMKHPDFIEDILVGESCRSRTIKIEAHEGGETYPEKLQVTLMFEDAVGNECNANLILKGQADTTPVFKKPKATTEIHSPVLKEMVFEKSKPEKKPKRGNAYGTDYGSWGHDRKEWRRCEREKRHQEREKRHQERKQQRHLEKERLAKELEERMSVINEEIGQDQELTSVQLDIDTSTHAVDSDHEDITKCIKETVEHCLDIFELMVEICTEVGSR